MTFNPVSYFAGIGTVFVAVAVGFGGGLLITRSDHKVDTPNRLERVTASAPPVTPPVAPPPAVAPAPVVNASAAPAAPEMAPATPVVAKAADKAAEQIPPAPPTQVTATGQQAAPPQAQPAEATRVQSPQPASNEQPVSARDAFARSHDQDADMRRRGDRAERRQAERERRKWKWIDRKRRQQDLDGAAEEVRHIDRSDGDRVVVLRESGQKEDLRGEAGQRDVREAGQKDVIEMPRLNFFGQE